MEGQWLDFNDEELYNVSTRYGLSSLATFDDGGKMTNRPLVELALTLFELEKYADKIQ